MSNQEAIRLIQNLPTMCEFTDAYGEPIDSDAYYEAVDMAISALQAQEVNSSWEYAYKVSLNMDNEKALDILSKQDAINTITAYPHGDVCVENMENMVYEIKNLSPTPQKPLVKDTISRQAAIDAMGKLYDEDLEAYGCEIPEMFDCDRAIEALNALPSAQPNGWLEQNKDKILQAGMEGREIDFRIGGRLFAIREKAQ